MKGWKRVALVMGFLFAVNFLVFGILSVPFWFFFRIGSVMKAVLKMSVVSSLLQVLYIVLVQE